MSDADGFLSDKQIEYLRGEHTPPNNNAEYQMRSKIRNRTKQALEEFDLLGSALSVNDIEQILFDSKADFEYEQWERAQGKASDEKMHLNSMIGIMTFFYLGTLSDPRPFVQWLTQMAIKRAHRRQNQVVRNIDVSISVDLGPKAEEIDTDDLSELSVREINTALSAGVLSFEELYNRQDELDHGGAFDFNGEAIESHLNVDSSD